MRDALFCNPQVLNTVVVGGAVDVPHISHQPALEVTCRQFSYRPKASSNFSARAFPAKGKCLAFKQGRMAVQSSECSGNSTLNQ